MYSASPGIEIFVSYLIVSILKESLEQENENRIKTFTTKICRGIDHNLKNLAKEQIISD